jgi:hypothetical protein
MSNLDTIVVADTSQSNDYSVKNAQYETRKAIRTLPMNRVMNKNNIETFIGESTKYTSPQQVPVKKHKKKSSQNVQRASIADAIPTPSTIPVSENITVQVDTDPIPLMQPVSVVNNKINTNLCLKLYTLFIIFGLLCLLGFFVYKLVRKHKNNENSSEKITNETIEGGKSVRKRDARGRFIKSK